VPGGRAAVTRAWIVAAVLALPGTTRAQVTPAAQDGPALLAQVVAEANDAPRTTLAAEQARSTSSRTAADLRFWSLLAQSRIHTLLEQPVEAARAMK
jgi:hypothetical protein